MPNICWLCGSIALIVSGTSIGSKLQFISACDSPHQFESHPFADRLRGAVQSLRIETGRGIERITISVGVVGREADMTDMEALIAAADKALYAAKHAGRNRTCLIAKGKVLCGNS
jgi:diguanylate cyclase (GGDEF)-like protein